MSEAIKELQLNDKIYTIKKFTPVVACFWATKLFGAMLGSSDSDFLSNLQTFVNMDFEQFKKIQKDCLSKVFYRLESGNHCIINQDGFINDLSLSAPQVLTLTVLSFVHSMSDFFVADQLQTLGEQVAEYFPIAGQEISSMPPSEQNTGDSSSYGTEPMI